MNILPCPRFLLCVYLFRLDSIVVVSEWKEYRVPAPRQLSLPFQLSTVFFFPAATWSLLPVPPS